MSEKERPQSCFDAMGQAIEKFRVFQSTPGGRKEMKERFDNAMRTYAKTVREERSSKIAGLQLSLEDRMRKLD